MMLIQNIYIINFKISEKLIFVYLFVIFRDGTNRFNSSKISITSEIFKAMYVVLQIINLTV